MKTAYKVVIAAFALVGLASTVTLLSQKAYAQDSKNPQFASQQEKGEKEQNEGDEKGEKEGDEATEQTMKAPMAKVSPVQAMAAAEKSVGGKAHMAIFEFDEGHWIYGVVVVKNHKLMEVDVDPVTGKAGDHEDVTPADEAQEFSDALAKIQKGN